MGVYLTTLRTDLVFHFSLAKRCLLYKGRMVIPNNKSINRKLLHEYHDSAMGGHNEVLKTYLRLVANWYP